MESQAVARLSFDELVDLLADEDVEALSLKDGTYIRVERVTSVNKTKEEVRVILHGCRPKVFPISEISEIIVA